MHTHEEVTVEDFTATRIRSNSPIPFPSETSTI